MKESHSMSKDPKAEWKSNFIKEASLQANYGVPATAAGLNVNVTLVLTLGTKYRGRFPSSWGEPGVSASRCGDDRTVPIKVRRRGMHTKGKESREAFLHQSSIPGESELRKASGGSAMRFNTKDVQKAASALSLEAREKVIELKFEKFFSFSLTDLSARDMIRGDGKKNIGAHHIEIAIQNELDPILQVNYQYSIVT
ncbi:hypothetical protein E2562_018500 [Oryza meyeriana var. granulata]|uniref:Uncharacterized protein n=1 Tax=Oryza meyeriana var. granulata TaxID=110450 RepID=A0A6G1EML3_9ORYZ|nr:hypothetical protein E2562_018500 [Oryza meyeriana var. granulata]